MARPGRLSGLGVGPGDPELITVKALRLLQEAAIVAYPAAKGKKGNAFSTVEPYLRPDQALLPLIFPVTTRNLPSFLRYESVIADFYNDAATRIARHLDAGRDVAVLCEGDPFFYGSFMYLYARLAGHYPIEVVPGVCSIVAGAAVLGVPLVCRNQSLTVLSAMLPEQELVSRLLQAEAAAILKLGANFGKVRRIVTQLGYDDRALYIERATMPGQRSLPLAQIDPATVPYFSMILIPGQQWPR
jgi:precorrin-2/cobalt-factor-2 C20-methyltransferase